MKQNTIYALALSLISTAGVAQSAVIAPQPTSCLTSSFAFQPSKLWFWRTVALTVTNHCDQAVDLQNASITFLNSTNLNTNFSGDFSALTTPNNHLQISSQPVDDHYVSTFSLQFPSTADAITTLPVGGSFVINYSASAPDYQEDSVRIYLNSSVNTGNVRLIAATAQPANVTESYALVNLSLNGEVIGNVSLPWSGRQLVSGLAAGTYEISPVNIDATDGNLYEGVGQPTTVTVTNGDTVSSMISYTEKLRVGSIDFQLQSLPDALAGYADLPVVTMTREDNHSAQMSPIEWGEVYHAARLANQINYQFSAPDIEQNGYACKPRFEPNAAIALAGSAPVVNITYTCVRTAEDNVMLHITGVPATVTSIHVLFTPNGNGAPISETIAVIDGQGTGVVPAIDGGIYTVSIDQFDGYTVGYALQPLTISEGVIETITYTPNPINNVETAVTNPIDNVDRPTPNPIDSGEESSTNQVDGDIEDSQ